MNATLNRSALCCIGMKRLVHVEKVPRILSMTSSVQALLKTALLPLILAACVSNPPAPPAPDAFRDPAFQPPPRGAALTILPPQETQYDELRAGAELVHKQLHKQLTNAGYRVTVLKRDDYLRRWKQEAEAVGGVYQPDSGTFKGKEYVQALETLIRKSCEETQCALLIDARLVVRPAEIIGTQVVWDGQKRFSNEPAAPGSATSTQTYGISIEVSGIQPDGSLAFKNYGGAILPPQYSVVELQSFKPNPMSWNDADIASGLGIALKPLLDKPVAQKTATEK